MANISPIPKFKNLKTPKNFPDFPYPGKIELLWNSNRKDIYRRFSPYKTENFIGIKTRQPFQYIYPDEKKIVKGIVSTFTRSVVDTKRMVNFLGSSGGTYFLIKQFLLQSKNAFNETRLYNPTSVIISAASPIVLGTIRPTRHVEKSNILGSLLGNIGAIISKGMGLNTEYKPPSGTVGYAALANKNSSHGKGLLRAHTANKAKSIIISKWSESNSRGGKNILKSLFNSVFGNFITQKQDNIIYRSDELTYGLMLSNKSEFSYTGNNLVFSGTHQRWYGGEKGGIRKNAEIPFNRKKLIIFNFKDFQLIDFNETQFTINGQNVGYHVTPSKTDSPVKYGDYVGIKKENSLEGGSEILSAYSIYSEEDKYFKTKFSKDFADISKREVVESLRKNIESIKLSSVYEWSEGIVKSKYEGYNDLNDVKNSKISNLYTKNLNYTKVLDNSIQPNNYGVTSIKMASSKRFDAINLLEVLDKDKKIKNSPYPEWTEWKPYSDDLIAFYFYDLVNEKFIPFRATLRGLNETCNANWENLEFTGRADRLYVYNNFSRTLGFSFTVYISSIKELFPTWKKINYLSGLVMPSRYTKSERLPDSRYNRFIVPPMVLLTIGDMYKDQPIIITVIDKSIPDNARWETLTEESEIKEWNYLAGSLKLKDKNTLYAQLPTIVNITISANILEKERPNTGNALIGNAFHTEEYLDGVFSKNGPNSRETPNKFDQQIIVYQK